MSAFFLDHFDLSEGSLASLKNGAASDRCRYISKGGLFVSADRPR
jgi:hypothetical protein